MRKPILIGGGILLIVAGIVIIPVVALVTIIQPEIYAATARIIPAVSEPAALSNEIGKLKSAMILDQVVTNLDLAGKWGQKYGGQGALPLEAACTLLRSRLAITLVPKTDIIAVSVQDEDASAAALIANEIVSVYRHSPLAVQAHDGRTIQVLDSAQPSLRPVRPNKALNFALGFGLGGFLIVAGILCLLFGARSPAVKPVP
jgi:uncharacterized protein involved in exopolysaccharide biosynthesis